MLTVDAHQHFWAPARGDYGWMGSSEALAPLRRDFLPKDYEPVRERWGIDKTVLVQAAPTSHETDYMLGLADASDFIAKVVGWIDFENAEERARLENYARHQKFAGVRPMIQDIPDVEWMHRADIDWAYDAIVDLDLTFDALGYPIHLEGFLRLFERHPKMRTVIDHGMKPTIRNRDTERWARIMERIARSTPVYCKLSGLATEAEPGWSIETLKPYAEHIVHCFGPERVMWGSDWPVLNLNGSFDRWRDASLKILGGSRGARMILGGTAQAFYRIEG
jgi:L-fuconolactonase